MRRVLAVALIRLMAGCGSPAFLTTPGPVSSVTIRSDAVRPIRPFVLAQAPQDASGNVTLVVPPGYERYDVLSAVVRLNPWLAPTAQLLGHILPGITAAL